MANVPLDWVIRAETHMEHPDEDRKDLPLIPEKFVALCEGLDTKPHEATGWLVLADWCQENTEPDLEAASRWIAKRVPKLRLIRPDAHSDEWRLDGLPKAIQIYWQDETGSLYIRNLSQLVSFLARCLARYREDAE